MLWLPPKYNDISIPVYCNGLVAFTNHSGDLSYFELAEDRKLTYEF